MIIINDKTDLTLRKIDEDTNELTISSYDKDGNKHKSTIILTGAEHWEGLEEIPVDYGEPFNLEKTVANLNCDSYKRYKDWISKLRKETKVICELPINNTILINVTYEDDLNKPKKQNNHNWKKDKFWK